MSEGLMTEQEWRSQYVRTARRRTDCWGAQCWKPKPRWRQNRRNWALLLLGAWGLCLYITSRSLMDDARREEAVLHQPAEKQRHAAEKAEHQLKHLVPVAEYGRNALEQWILFVQGNLPLFSCRS